MSGAENSFTALQNNFMRKIVTNMPSKLTSGPSSIRRGMFDFDQSTNSGQLPTHVKTQRTDKDTKQITQTE